MARPKGSTNRTPEAKAFVARIERQLKREGHLHGLEGFACKFITQPEDIKTGFGVWRELLRYKYGMPTQPVEMQVSVIDELAQRLEKARKRVAK